MTVPVAAPGDLRSVTIALATLQCFLTDEELGASEVARRVGVAKSTASRTLATLCSGSLLDRVDGGRYRLGLRLFDYGQLAIERLRLRELALPVLGDLRDHIGDTVQIGIPSGSEVLYIDRLEGLQGLRFHTDLYRRVPGHSSSAGKAIAAFNPAFFTAVAQAPMHRHTPRTIAERRTYRRVIAEVRERGYAESQEEFEVGLSSVAAPVMMRWGTRPAVAVAALSCAGPTSRIVGTHRSGGTIRGRGSIIARHVIESAARLSAALLEAHESATPA